METTITDAQGRQIGDVIVVHRHGDGTPFPYYPVRVTMATPGTYGVAIAYQGSALTGQVVFAAPEAIMLVQPGERAIPVVTPTPADHRGVEPICTRDPACPFHDVTLSDALSSGRPTALLISSPAYCQTNVCGPVLELLMEEGAGRPMNLVHAEVYADAAATGDVLKANAERDDHGLQADVRAEPAGRRREGHRGGPPGLRVRPATRSCRRRSANQLDRVS